MLKAFTPRRIAFATLIVAVVVAAHVRKMYEAANPEAYQLFKMGKED